MPGPGSRNGFEGPFRPVIVFQPRNVQRAGATLSRTGGRKRGRERKKGGEGGKRFGKAPGHESLNPFPGPKNDGPSGEMRLKTTAGQRPFPGFLQLCNPTDRKPGVPRPTFVPVSGFATPQQ